MPDPNKKSLCLFCGNDVMFGEAFCGDYCRKNHVANRMKRTVGETRHDEVNDVCGNCGKSMGTSLQMFCSEKCRENYLFMTPEERQKNTSPTTTIPKSIIDSVVAELKRADEKYKHDPMTDAKVGILTIKCEIMELERELARAHPNKEWIRREAIQSAAMCIKFLRDICGKEF